MMRDPLSASALAVMTIIRDEHVLFFPFGFRRSGYVLTTAIENRLKSRASVFVLASAALLALSSFVLSGPIAMASLLLPFLAYGPMVRRTLRGCPAVSGLAQLPTLADTVAREAKALGVFWASLTLALPLAVFSVGFLLLLDRRSFTLALVYLSFFGTCVAFQAWILVVAIQARIRGRQEDVSHLDQKEGAQRE